MSSSDGGRVRTCGRADCGCVTDAQTQFIDEVCPKCAHAEGWHKLTLVPVKSISTIRAPTTTTRNGDNSSFLTRESSSGKTARDLEIEMRMSNQNNQFCIFTYTPVDSSGNPQQHKTQTHTHFFADGDVVEREVARYLLPSNLVNVCEITAIEDVKLGVVLQVDDRMDVSQLRNRATYVVSLRDVREDALVRLGIPPDMSITASNLRSLGNDQIDEIVAKFERIDVHCTGYLDLRELEALYANDAVAQESNLQLQVHSTYEGFSPDNAEGGAQVPSARLFEQKRRERSRKALAKLFLDQYDTNGDGEVDLREFLLAQAHAIEMHDRLLKRLAKGRKVRLNDRGVQVARLKERRKQAEYTRKLKQYNDRTRAIKPKPKESKEGHDGGDLKHDTSFLNGKNMAQEFKMIDVNNDGYITQTELATLMERLGETRSRARTHSKAFFQLADTDNDGKVNFEEFLASYSRMQLFKTVRLLKERFEEFDTNRDLSLSKTELYQALTKFYGYTQARQILDDVFAKLDANNDGMIDLQELEYWTFARADQVMQERKRERHELNLRKLRHAA